MRGRGLPPRPRRRAHTPSTLRFRRTTTMAESAPYDLRIDSGGDEFPVSGPRPRLSWKLPPGAGGDDGYELEARIDGADERRVEETSPEHLFVPWPWRPLRSAERVAWRVRALGAPGAG